MEIEEAINSNPREVRNLLIDALLACCRHEALSDTMDALYAEESFRLALSHSYADSEKEYRQEEQLFYVVSRGKPKYSREGNEFLTSAFRIGGYFALIATMAATHYDIDCSRKRRTLESLAVMKDESRHDL
jgi:hypothetical protein